MSHDNNNYKNDNTKNSINVYKDWVTWNLKFTSNETLWEFCLHIWNYYIFNNNLKKKVNEVDENFRSEFMTYESEEFKIDRSHIGNFMLILKCKSGRVADELYNYIAKLEGLGILKTRS